MTRKGARGKKKRKGQKAQKKGSKRVDSPQPEPEKNSRSSPERRGRERHCQDDDTISPRQDSPAVRSKGKASAETDPGSTDSGGNDTTEPTLGESMDQEAAELTTPDTTVSAKSENARGKAPETSAESAGMTGASSHSTDTQDDVPEANPPDRISEEDIPVLGTRRNRDALLYKMADDASLRLIELVRAVRLKEVTVGVVFGDIGVPDPENQGQDNQEVNQEGIQEDTQEDNQEEDNREEGSQGECLAAQFSLTMSTATLMATVYSRRKLSPKGAKMFTDIAQNVMNYSGEIEHVLRKLWEDFDEGNLEESKRDDVREKWGRWASIMTAEGRQLEESMIEFNRAVRAQHLGAKAGINLGVIGEETRGPAQGSN